VPESQKRERQQIAGVMRAQGKTWVEIAELFRARYRVNALVAYRYARGWSQERAAHEWCNRWPDELKTHKHFSYWEVYPASTGHPPSLPVLCHLAELYECGVGDLLVDLPNYRGNDSAHKALVTADQPTPIAGEIVVPHQAETLFLDLLNASPVRQCAASSLAPDSGITPLGWQLQAVNFDELAKVIVMWARELDPNVGRRELLTKLSAAFAVAAAAPMFGMFDADEREYVSRFLTQDGSGFDETVLRYCEEMVNTLNRQSDALGPQLTMQSVVGHRELAYRLAKAAPAQFRQRAVSAYAEFTRLVAWLCFNLGDHEGSAHYYEDARSAAHDAQNVELVTFVLCAMSQLATCRGKPRIGIDHAVAAAAWADQTDSPHARAYAADVAVRAHIADNRPDLCRSTLDREYTTLMAASPGTSVSRLWYFYDESFYWRTAGEHALKLGRPDEALDALDRSLALVDPANLHNKTFRLLFRVEARIQQDEVVEACTILGNVGQDTAATRSHRIDRRIDDLRDALTPWERTKPVRELDKRLAAYR
jgi:tetratricopeptide (TPR) repeat protein